MIFQQKLAKVFDVSRFARFSQTAFLIRRALGLPASETSAFSKYVCDTIDHDLTENALVIRGRDYQPAIFVHGVLPRSGTNYLADAIALHPDTAQNPGALWEFPLLYVAGGAQALQREFEFMFPPNANVLKQHEMLSYLSSGWLRALQAQSGPQTMVLKSPHMQHLALFPYLFPRDRVLILMRDGRDVLQSSLTTFGDRWFGKSFSAMAAEWSASAGLALAFAPGGPCACEQALVVRYEDLIREGRSAMERVLSHCGLNQASYDWDAFDRLPLRGSSTSTAAVTEKWKQIPRPESFNPLGRWHAWPHARKVRFKKWAGETLIAAGYAQDFDW